MGQTKTNFSGARLSQARTVLACSPDLALAVLAGTKPLDAAYGEAKKAKQQLDGKGVAKSRRAANMRLRKRSAGDHNHEGPGTRPRTLSYGPARACFCRSSTASKQSPTTMEK